MVRRKGAKNPTLGGASLWKNQNINPMEAADGSGRLLKFYFSLTCVTCLPLVRWREVRPAGRAAVHRPALLRRVVARQRLAGRLLLQPQLPDPGTLHLRRPLRQAGQEDAGQGWFCHTATIPHDSPRFPTILHFSPWFPIPNDFPQFPKISHDSQRFTTILLDSPRAKKKSRDGKKKISVQSLRERLV